MVSLLIVLGAMLAGATAFIGLVFLVHGVIGCMLFRSDAMVWFMLPAAVVGPFLGAGIGLTVGLAYFGFNTFARMVAVLFGIVFLGISFRMTMPVSVPPEGWPVLYTFRHGLRVIFQCAPTVVAGSVTRVGNPRHRTNLPKAGFPGLLSIL